MEIKLSNNSKVDAQLIMTGRGCIIGQSGSGKSFLVGIIAEELSKLGLPYCIIDTEGEYATLKKHFKAIVIGGSNQDFEFDAELSNLFHSSIKQNVPMILDLSDETDKSAKVYSALEEIYKIEEKLRKPYLILIEEADKFVPQLIQKKINIIEELSVRGRKRGIGLIVATQRPSSISKNVLSQCSYGFIGKLTIGNDLKAIQQLFSDKSKLKEIVNLSIGEFIPFGTKSSDKFKVRITDVTYKGATPSVNIGEAKALRPGLEEIVVRLKSNNHMRKRENTEGKRKISALSLKFSMHDAHVFARNIATRRFGLFGRPIERPDSIKTIYLNANLCKIRVPTKKKYEFIEYNFLMDREFRLIRLLKGLQFQKDRGGKPTKLNPFETTLLSELRSRKRTPIKKIGKLGLGNTTELQSAIKKLAASKLILKDAKNIHAENYRNYLMAELPEIEQVYLPITQLASEKNSKEEVKAYTSNLYPNSVLVDISTIYIPIYEIILRHKNKVRIFRIDAIYGKEIPNLQ